MTKKIRFVIGITLFLGAVVLDFFTGIFTKD